MPGPDQSSRRPRRSRRGAALTLVFATVLATGAATGGLPRDDGTEARPRAVDPAGATVDQDEVARAAARAVADGESGTEAAEEVVARGGDRWGAVYDEREYRSFQQSLDGEYTGVGLWARQGGDGRVEVARVRSGGPADRAGVRAGDRLRTVDGKTVDRRPVTEVVALLRGEERTSVALGLERSGRSWTRSLTRATLSTESVTVERLDGGAVIIRVAAFTRGAGDRVREAVRRAPDGAGVLLDLRGNSGGLVNEAVDTASVFLDGGLVATYDMRGAQRALYAKPGGDTGRPVVALVDGGTMSAAEMVTGALQDRGRAVTVGSRTFGKGSVQMPSELPDGSVAELTVGHYRTPSGREVDGLGITPDVTVEDDAEDRARTVLDGLGPAS
ncbi:S41 family peptidase [Streptomyces katsurahamanus]|uniref:PDZ domain-containing protein n=1 Tax=Streptomyces katsurahamanus TaxID=2577098 RepID=A0ABW9NP59_9ACTN|nr:S41 family peptidase [Streptomyces katsurahamanus]MQS35072.1 PDZ domain-containing protein [Streptomyces katsurahamanus]